MHRVKCHFKLLLILAGCCISGCFGINPVSPTHFYVLNPVHYETPLVSPPKIPLSVEIASFGLPQYLEKPQIITRSRQNRLKMAEYHQWGGNLRKNMIQVVAQNLSRVLATPNVAMAPFRRLHPPDIRVDVEVMQFESDDKGQVQFSGQFRLSRGTGKILTTQMVDLKSPVPESLPDYDRIVFVMGELLGDFCHIIGKEILDQAGKPPSP